MLQVVANFRVTLPSVLKKGKLPSMLGKEYG